MKSNAILDANGSVIAELDEVRFDSNSNAYLGRIRFVAPPEGLKALLQELDECINNQVFVVAAELQDKVDKYNLSARLEDGTTKEICDLNVNKEGGFSFRSRPAVYPWLETKA